MTDRQELRVESARHFRIPPRALAVPIRLYQDFIPVTTGSVDGIPGDIAIDLGGRSALTLFGPFWRAHRLDEMHGPTFDAMTGYGIGGPIKAKLTRIQELKFGEVSVAESRNEVVATTKRGFADPRIVGSISGAILGRFDVTFDYPQALIVLVPRANVVEATPDRSGAWFAVDAGGVYVYAVAPGSPAAEAGLQAKDRVVEVNGTATDAVGVFKLRRAAADARANNLELVVERPRGRLTVVMQLRDLVPSRIECNCLALSFGDNFAITSRLSSVRRFKGTRTLQAIAMFPGDLVSRIKSADFAGSAIRLPLLQTLSTPKRMDNAILRAIGLQANRA